jgi:sulfide:quinone oxidoreductase
MSCGTIPRVAPPRILVLGAGFGGLELSTTLSDALGDELDLTLIDAGDAFVFGYSKLDVMFGRTPLDAVRLPYSAIAKPGVRFVQERVTAIDPERKSVTTDAGTHDADYLVVALGADYDYDHTPGLSEADEFYSVAGAARLAGVLPEFTSGRAVVGVCDAPFKCPPAPSECALLVHDLLTARGVRDDCEIALVMPFGTPVPPSPDTSAALLEAFAERGIEWVPGVRVSSVEADKALLDDGSSQSFDLFLGVPKHRAPEVVQASGMAENGYIPVDGKTLTTKYAGVYAVGDVATVGTPKAGVFAERQASVVAHTILAELTGGDPAAPYDGTGSCYIEFGADRVARVDVDFFSDEKPTGTFQEPSAELVAEKKHFGSSCRSRWFGL